MQLTGNLSGTHNTNLDIQLPADQSNNVSSFSSFSFHLLSGSNIKDYVSFVYPPFATSFYTDTLSFHAESIKCFTKFVSIASKCILNSLPILPSLLA